MVFLLATPVLDVTTATPATRAGTAVIVSIVAVVVPRVGSVQVGWVFRIRVFALLLWWLLYCGSVALRLVVVLLLLLRVLMWSLLVVLGSVFALRRVKLLWRVRVAVCLLRRRRSGLLAKARGLVALTWGLAVPLLGRWLRVRSLVLSWSVWRWRSVEKWVWGLKA